MKDVAPRIFKSTAMKTDRGLIIIYTGEGKGKSTAAFGAVFRSLGRGYKAAVVQFIKGKWVSGEINALKRFDNQVNYHSVGEGFTWETKNLGKDIELARQGWEICKKLMREGRHKIYLFDEILYVLKYQFLSLSEVKKGLKLKPFQSHVILTGRGAPKSLVRMADLVTEMKEIKHPFQKGFLAQPGIDY